MIDHLIKSEYYHELEQLVIGLTELAKGWEDIRNLNKVRNQRK